MSTDKMDRRGFLGFITWAIGGIIGLAMATPAIAYLISPAIKRNQKTAWLMLGSTAKVELDLPTLFKTKITKQTGWIENNEEISVYALTENSRDFIAMSNICTHLGCRVRWIADKQGFYCPCHNAVFDKAGNVVSGPPPRPLDRYDVKVENDQLFIKVG